MKKVLLLLLMASPAYGETYSFYIVFSSRITQPERNFLDSKKFTDRIQPARSITILTPINTNYLVVGNPGTVDVNNFKTAGKIDLYQTYIYEDGKVRLDIDKSNIYDLTKDWSQP